MKRFKNTFGIKGNDRQIDAFIDYLKTIGYEISGNPKWSAIFVKKGEANRTIVVDGVTTSKPVYRLPSQWAEAMKAASEVEETVFIEGKKYVNYKGMVVLCVHVPEQNKFITQRCDAVVINTDNDSFDGKYKVGNYLERIPSDCYTLHEHPVTI